MESCGKDNGNGDEGGSPEKTRDPKELYGLWMQVVNRRRKALGTRSNEHGRVNGNQRVGAMGSRYAILREDVETAQDSEQRRDDIVDQALKSGTVHDEDVR
ncbi:hypothetical protein V6N13_051106 [Hibiscus sabdariffa]